MLPSPKVPKLTRGQVARRLSTSPQNVAKMHAEGVLVGEQDSETGIYYYDADEVAALASSLPAVRRDQENSNLTVQLVQSLMMHTDRSTKNVLEVNDHLLKANERYQARIAQLEAEIGDAWGTLKELSDDRHRKELEIVREERHDKAIAFAMEKISLLWPIVQTKLFGVPLKAGQHPAWDALSSFLNSLKPDQLQGLVGSLSGDQLAAFENLTKLLTEEAPGGAEGAT